MAPKLPEMVGAVIYVRVSTKEQTENLSLPTQLRACEEYCRRQGYEVLERFHEEGESAKTTDRSQLQALLKYCRTNKGKVHFVVVYNLTRFAREKYDHFALRAHLKSLGISLRSATEPIDDTSTGKLMEGVLAAFAQFDNDVRSDRTRAGMKAALELGRWTFLAPLGYLNAPKWSARAWCTIPERAPLVRQSVRGPRDGTIHEAGSDCTHDRRRACDAGRGCRVATELRPHDAEPDLRRQGGEPGLRRVDKRGDFEPLVDEARSTARRRCSTAASSSTGPRQRERIRTSRCAAFVRCETCGRGCHGELVEGPERLRTRTTTAAHRAAP